MIKLRLVVLSMVGVLAMAGVQACRNNPSSSRWWENEAQREAPKGELEDFSPQAEAHAEAVPTPRPTPPGHRIDVAQNQLFVEGTVITVSDVLADILPELKRKSRQQSRKAYLDELTNELAARIRGAVIEVLVYRRALESTDLDEPQGPDEVAPLDKAAEMELRKIINNVAEGSQARYEQLLAEAGTDLQARKKAIKRRLLVDRYLREKLLPRVDITRRDLMRYYRAHQEQYQKPRTVEFFLIEVWVSRFLPRGLAAGAATPQQWAQARRQADAYVSRIMSELRDHQMPFEQVCRTYSHAPNAIRGGKWLPISEPIAGRDGEMLPATQAALKMNAGQISEPILSPSGKKIFIVRVGRVTPGMTRSFVEVQPEIRKKLEERQFHELAVQYEKKIWDKATIPRLEPFLRACLMAAP